MYKVIITAMTADDEYVFEIETQTISGTKQEVGERLLDNLFKTKYISRDTADGKFAIAMDKVISLEVQIFEDGESDAT